MRRIRFHSFLQLIPTTSIRVCRTHMSSGRFSVDFELASRSFVSVMQNDRISSALPSRTAKPMSSWQDQLRGTSTAFNFHGRSAAPDYDLIFSYCSRKTRQDMRTLEKRRLPQALTRNSSRSSRDVDENNWNQMKRRTGRAVQTLEHKLMKLLIVSAWPRTLKANRRQMHVSK